MTYYPEGDVYFRTTRAKKNLDRANPKKQVFKLQFAIDEFDMVVVDAETVTDEIYELKYTKEIIKERYRRLGIY